MPYTMDPNKSGVMIYFEPMREEANNLDSNRLGDLFRAILNYAATGEEPVFEDETLTHLWRFVRTNVIRDDKTYRNKSERNQYAAFCRYAKEHGHDKPIPREYWVELGKPTFSQWQTAQILRTEAGTQVHASAMQRSADVCGAMQTDTDAVQRMPTSYSVSPSLSITSSLSPSVSVSGARPAPDGAADTRTAPANVDQCVPYEVPTLEEVRRYCRQKELKYADPEAFHNHYQSTGWTLSNGQRVVDWKARLRRWDANDRARGKEAVEAGENSDEVGKYVRKLKEKRKKERKS
ncbi:MAG: hypothetical protein IJR48_04060 [Oscillibacter sp.]|nr:hypothetical protein [Oscillibacter sp.]MBQ9617519.1 hypothetical protein [Oscillibacter sp.]